MSKDELDRFLATERTARVATVDRGGRPHVTPLWFVWDGQSMWFSSLVRSSRWAHLQERPDVAVVVDAGVEYDQLRGAELRGAVAVVGEIPREAVQDPRLDAVEAAIAAKYHPEGPFTPDGRHAWLRLTPRRIVTWDFRKIDR